MPKHFLGEFFPAQKIFFFNFEGPVFSGNEYDYTMCKATDIPLRSFLSKCMGICSISFPKSEGKWSRNANNHNLAILNCRVKI